MLKVVRMRKLVFPVGVQSVRFLSKMIQEVHVQGYDAFKTEVDKHKGKTVYALFSGSVGEDGNSWCPDCVAADPVIKSNLQKAPDDGVFIHCGVGDRAFWKDQNNAFRKNLHLKSVPTLMVVGKPQKLEEEQCANGELVAMLFSDE